MNRLLRPDELAALLETRGVPVTLGLNPGGHFQECSGRIAKGIDRTNSGAPISEETGASVGEKKWETLIDAAVQMTIRPVISMTMAAMAPTRMTAATISSLLLNTFSTPASLRAL